MVDVSAGLTPKQFCECEAPWKSDEYIGVQFLDILGPSRRRRFLAGEKIPVRRTDHKIAVMWRGGRPARS